MNRLLKVVGVIIITSLLACGKSKEDKTAKLVIILQQSAVSINQIDSADVVFRKTGTNTQVRQRFVKTTQNLEAPLQSLTPGAWNADIEVYTKAVNQQSNQYVIIKPIQVTTQSTEIQVPGPAAAAAIGWVKRHVKASPGNQVVLIVPDDVNDPYFEFRSKQQGLLFGIQREAINVNHVVKQQNWTCFNNCLNAEGRIMDITHFLPFTQMITSSPWTRNDISISVLNNPNEELLTYKHTWNK